MDPTTRALMMGAAAGGAAPIEFVASAQATTSSTSTLTISKPTGTQSGDLMVAIMAADSNRTWTGDTGWTEVIDQGVIPCLRVAYLVAGASEPSSYAFTSSGNARITGVIATFRNAAYDVVGSISTTHSSSTQTAPAITLSQSGGAVIAFFACDNTGRLWTNPTSGLIATANKSDSATPSWALYRELNLSAGSTGTRSATANGGVSSPAAILVGIKPA
jgi:hypothetical protein